jgi:hypothetical protein
MYMISTPDVLAFQQRSSRPTRSGGLNIVISHFNLVEVPAGLPWAVHLRISSTSLKINPAIIESPAVLR